MKRMIILLSATTLTLAPLVSNAKKPQNISDFDLEVLSCSCATEQTSEEEVLYTCDVSWTDAIAGAVNPATYGASIDVEWEQEDDGMDGSRSVDLEYDWNEVCDNMACTVEDKQFILTNYTDQVVTLTAAVKAFENRSHGKTPRNFMKSTLECAVDPIVDPI
jgi:hypothetical protein